MRFAILTNLYYGALQRDPTSSELQDKVNQLAAAGATSQSQLLTVASQIARSLFTGTNYETNVPARTDGQYVADLYYAYLQRGPDDSGLGWWTGQVVSSGRTNVCNAFEGSSEFVSLVTTLYGTAASDNERAEHLVNNFYLGAYGRNATSTELQTQRDALNAAAAQGLSQVQSQAESFGRSLFAAQVNDSGISNTQYVTNLYEAFLQRGPDAGGLGFWSGQASVGTGRQNVLNAFATCGSFYELAGTLYREAFWLVSDRLGTPRMIVSKSGTLASVKRHDYLPFGEELYAGTGGRATTQGYTGDSTRQHFTGYEADAETGLNFAEARYQSPAQGRFTSVDPLGASASVLNPQSFNRYSYVENNPTNLTDPTGMMTGADASQSWGDVSGTFWGEAFDFNASHFGGPEIIANGMDYFQDRVDHDSGTTAYNGNGIVDPGETDADEAPPSQTSSDTVAFASVNIVGGDPIGGEPATSATGTCSIQVDFFGEKSPDNDLTLQMNPKGTKLDFFENKIAFGQQVQISGTFSGTGWTLSQTVTSKQRIVFANGLTIDGRPTTNLKDAPPSTSQQWGSGNKFFATDSPGFYKLGGSVRYVDQVQNFTTSLTNGRVTCSAKWGTSLRIINDKVTSHGVGRGHYPLNMWSNTSSPFDRK